MKHQEEMPWLIKADSVFVTLEFEAAIYKTREFKGRIVKDQFVSS